MLLLIAIIFIFITPFYWIYKPPNFLIRYFQRRWPAILWQVEASSKVVALTIDDGPSEFTDEIRGILREHDAKATFFIIGGQVGGRERVLKDLVMDGHELGNHAMHDEPSRFLSDATLVSEIKAVDKMLQTAYASVEAAPPKYFRPGSGFFSDRMLNIMDKLGYRLVLGSVYPHDPQLSFWRVNARHILSMVKPGSIIICHDRRSWTAPMLRKVLPELKRRGYRVVTVTDLLRESRA
jgi:peptidoglycan/xylan/chitin deacetylase (PgdA/CDA1 family)